MRVEIIYVNSQFIALDQQGVPITDRNILDQISFDPAVLTTHSRYVQVKRIKNSVKTSAAHISISTTHT